MTNYMKNVAEMLGVKLHEGFNVIHDKGRSLAVLEEEGIRFINHIGCLKEDAPAICLQEILNGNFRIEHIDEEEITKENKQNGIWIETKNSLGIREYECSICGHHDNKHTAIRGRYCWYCGSKMEDVKYLEE